jgi:DNA processing protein
MSTAVDLIALSLLPIWRWRAVAEQLRNGQTPDAILHAQCRSGFRGGGGTPAWTNPSWVKARAHEAAERGLTAGLRVIGIDADSYPARLREIADPPPVLWVSGQPEALADPIVSIVGSRVGSPYALSVAERLAGDLAVRGITIASGLARGVDSAAHRGALAAGGLTVGVLGCGADIVYPPEHATLASEIAERGAVTSELVPGTVPRPVFFPRRNRIISGLARAVIVIEAGEKSGSLITARCALEQGRDVLAVPGNVLSGRNRGGHALLKDGARLVETVEDVLEELGLSAAQGSRASTGAPAGPTDSVLASMMPGEPVDLEQISGRSGLSVAELLPRLLELELVGGLRREPGGRFVRVDRTC